MTNLPNDGFTDSSSEDFIIPTGGKHQKPKKKKNGKKIFLIILIVILSLLIALSAVFAVLWLSGKGSLLTDKKDVVIKPDESIDAEVYDDNTIFYNDSVYAFNENITTILCMGTDKEGTSTIGHSGQADAIFLVVIDTKTGKTSVIGIPRDSMAEVDLYTSSGSFIGVEKKQICLAFAYGDRKKKSCENVARAVSRLLCGMPVNSYFAVDYGSIETLHRAVGTVKVTLNEDMRLATSANGDSKLYSKGTAVNLTPHQAVSFLRSRNQTTTDAAYLRLERQIQYLKSYSAAAISKTKSDITFPVKLYNKIISNSITNIDTAKVTYLTGTVIGQKQNVSPDFIKLSGEYKVGENNYAELYLDENEVFETVLSIFYKKIK